MVVDPRRLTQILTNLVHNALKFSPPDAAVVSLRWSAPAEGTVVVRGHRPAAPGSSPEELERVFERFHQAESARSRTAEGFGLGLYITRQLAEAMGGWIDVDVDASAPASTFTVTLPASRPRQRPRDRPQQRRRTERLREVVVGAELRSLARRPPRPSPSRRSRARRRCPGSPRSAREHPGPLAHGTWRSSTTRSGGRGRDRHRGRSRPSAASSTVVAARPPAPAASRRASWRDPRRRGSRATVTASSSRSAKAPASNGRRSPTALADPDEAHGHAELLPHGEDDPAPGRSVGLRQDHARSPRPPP